MALLAHKHERAGRLLALGATIAFAWAGLGCHSRPFQFHRVDTAEILTPGVTIRAQDGSFQFVAGRPFPTPWNTSNCPMEPRANNWNLVGDEGKRVTVYHPASPKPLHGLLVFCPIPPASSQPGGRSHGIQIPDSYVDRAAGGLVSVVYSDVNHHWTYLDSEGKKQTADSWPTWILWLGDRPFQ